MVGNMVALFPFIRWPNNVPWEIPYTGTSPLWYLADRLTHKLFFFPRYLFTKQKNSIKCRPSYWQLIARAVISRLFARSTYYNGTARQEIGEALQ